MLGKKRETTSIFSGRLKTSTGMSLETGKMVRGHEIKRLPMRGYLKALDLLQDAPNALIAEMFPGMPMDKVVKELGKAGKDELVEIAMRAIGIVPDFALRLFSQLSELPMDVLLDDRAIGLDGLLEMVEAWVEVNGIGNFTNRLRGWINALLKAIGLSPLPNGGSSD